MVSDKNNSKIFPPWGPILHLSCGGSIRRNLGFTIDPKSRVWDNQIIIHVNFGSIKFPVSEKI